MENQPATASTASESLRSTYVYGMAAICLLAGLAIGALLQGWQSHRVPAQLAANAGAASSGRTTSAGQTASPERTMQTAGPLAQPLSNGSPASTGSAAMAGGHMHTLGEMKQMADKQAEPLKEKLKSDPNNSAVLMQVAAIYHATHQFKEAADYYAKAVQADPKNVDARTKLATSLYRNGDVDGALAQLNRALTYDPKDANALFDLGMIRFQGKQDGQGAVSAWQKLLATNPQMSSERRAQVQKLMADVLTTLGDQHAMEGARSNDGRKSNSN
ncbi:MAG: tetratricopeptide repeat protein [Terracidiphilus sp.]|jgi:cytochrome c-type biogenesis protein CcmH/NrfG